MYYINNQLYLDLTAHVDIDSLHAIEKEIILGIVKSKSFLVDGCANTSNCLDQSIPSLLDTKLSSFLRDPSNPNYKYYKALNFYAPACMTFSRYAGEYQQMGQTLPS